MENKLRKISPLAAMLALLCLMQTFAVGAEVGTRGIGGTGHTPTTQGGVGGTGHGSSVEGIGGTGHSSSESGIGGTGIIANKAGIGGTGHTQGDGGIGGTGIVGIVTGFGSIWVNGLEVQYDAKTQMANNIAVADANDLAIGQVVVVEAKGSDNALQADKISMVYAVAGEISAVGAANDKLTILGQTVSMNAQTIMQDDKQQAIAQFKQGEQVRVSGLRLANGEIVASRIERTAAILEPNLIGPVTAINGNVIEVYGLQIQAATTSGLSIGQEIAVAGNLSGGVLMAREITPSPSMQLYGRTEKINLQGYVGEGAKEGQIKVGNLEVEVTEPAQKTLHPGDLVQISGRFANDHRVIADRIEFSRDRPEGMARDKVNARENDRSDKHDRSDKVERSDRSEHDHADRNEHIDRPDKPDRSDHSDAEKHSDHKHD